MKRIVIIIVLLLAASVIFAQKTTPADTTRKKDPKTAVTDQSSVQKDQLQQEVHITPGSSGVKRSIGYRFSSHQEEGDPGNGIFRYNNASVRNVSFIFIDKVDVSGADQTKWYSTWNDTTGATGRGQLILADIEGTKVNVFDVTAVFTEAGGYWKIPVRYVSGAMPEDGSVYYYVFERIAHRAAAVNPGQGKEIEKTTTAGAAAATIASQTVPVQQVSEVNQSAPVQQPQTGQVTQPAPPAQQTQPVQTVQQPVKTPTATAPQTVQQQQQPLPPAPPPVPPSQSTQKVQNDQQVSYSQPPVKTYDSQFPVVYSYQDQGAARRKWYRGIIEVGYAFGVGDYGFNNFRFNFINGFTLGRYASIGLGIGYRRLFTENTEAPYLASSMEQIPVFIDLRTTFSQKTLTPYAALGIGSSSGSYDSETRQEGLLFTASGGIWWNITTRFALFAGIDYELQKLEFSDTTPYTNNYKKNASSLGINIGIAF